ncbi:MAG: hypothetical protein JWO03_2399 [Bacteroidetes bacterium]|nr:hypothetical protein [Bacteroidota bacterium]
MPVTPELKDFIIDVGPDGTFRPSGTYQTIPEHIDGMFQKFAADNAKEIVIYFHGGLVNEKNGIASAIKMATQFRAAGLTPVCFVWETGLIETVINNINKISDTKLFDKLVKLLIKKTSEKLGFDAVAGRGAGSMISDAEIEIELSKPEPFEKYDRVKNIATRDAVTLAAIPADDVLQRTLRDEVRDMIDDDPSISIALSQTELSLQSGPPGAAGGRGIISTAMLVEHIVKIAFRVIKRFMEKRDHDFYPTIVEEILREIFVTELGAWVWNNMKVKSQDMWKDNTNASGLNRYAGRYFLQKLLDYTKDGSMKVSLIGHSAGSIAICNLLEATTGIDPDFQYHHIAFMAPACRIDLFEEQMVKQQQRYKEFRMYTMKDAVEKNDRLVPFIYTHSLLYLISGALEDKGTAYDAYILGLERHINGSYADPALSPVYDYLHAPSTDRIVQSQTAAGTTLGYQSTAISHGGFDDDLPTVSSIISFLKNKA